MMTVAREGPGRISMLQKRRIVSHAISLSQSIDHQKN